MPKSENPLNNRTEYIHLNYLNAYLIEILFTNHREYIDPETVVISLDFVSQIMDGIRKLKEADEAKGKTHEN